MQSASPSQGFYPINADPGFQSPFRVLFHPGLYCIALSALLAQENRCHYQFNRYRLLGLFFLSMLPYRASEDRGVTNAQKGANEQGRTQFHR